MVSYSVLMPIYYKEKPEYFETAIRSVMSQTVLPNEIVLVCDGPLSDELNNKIEILSKELDCFNIVRLQKNEGIGKALAVGVTKAKNEIIMRMDSDDICAANRAEIQLPLMDKFDIVGGWVSEFENSPENIIGYKKMPENFEQIYKFAKKRNPFCHPAVMFKKQAILDAGNYQQFPYFEDYYLWIRYLISNDKAYNAQSVLVNMRSGREMRVRRGNKEARKSIKRLRKYMYQNKMINWFSYVIISFCHRFFLILPVGIKVFFYNHFLRKRS